MALQEEEKSESDSDSSNLSVEPLRLDLIANGRNMQRHDDQQEEQRIDLARIHRHQQMARDAPRDFKIRVEERKQRDQEAQLLN